MSVVCSEVLNAVEAERKLLILKDEVLRFEAGRFNFASWVGDDWQGKDDLSCGTTACAGGIATTIPEFQEMGLALQRGQGPWNEGLGYLIIRGDKYLGNLHLGDEYENSLRSLAKVFDISTDAAEFIFSPSYAKYAEIHVAAFIGDNSPPDNASNKDVAEHIQYFIDKYIHGKPVACRWPLPADVGDEE